MTLLKNGGWAGCQVSCMFNPLPPVQMWSRACSLTDLGTDVGSDISYLGNQRTDNSQYCILHAVGSGYLLINSCLLCREAGSLAH